MWIELGIPRPDVVETTVARTWINTDHIFRVDFVTENKNTTATVISIKPGGCDRSIFQGDDADRLLSLLKENRRWTTLPHEGHQPNPEPTGPVVNAAATVRMSKYFSDLTRG